MTGLYEFRDVMPCLLVVFIAIVLVFLTTRSIKVAVKRRLKHERWGGELEQNYIVNSTRVQCDGEECEIKRADRFRALAKYEDVLLIEILGDENNPYFVEKSSAKEFPCFHSWL